MKINGDVHRLGHDADRKDEVLESFASKQGGRTAALEFLKRAMNRHDKPLVVEIIQMSPRWTWQQDRKAEEEECSFLKKRTKKLLFSAAHFSGALATA